MRLNLNIPVHAGISPPRGLYKSILATVPVVVNIPEYSNLDIAPALSFETYTTPNSEEEPIETSFHEFHSIDDKLIKKHSASTEQSDLSEPIFYFHGSASRFDPSFFQGDVSIYHPFYREAFSRIAPLGRDAHNFTSSWGVKNFHPKALGAYIDAGRVADGYKLTSLSNFNINPRSQAGVDAQISLFNEYIKKFILVEGQIYQLVQEPIIEIRNSTKYNTIEIDLCDTSISSRPDEFIEKSKITARRREMFISMDDFVNISNHIESAGLSNKERIIKIGNVILSNPNIVNSNSAALTVLNKAISMTDEFNSSCASLRSGKGDVARRNIRDFLNNLTVEELGIYQSLVSAIKNASSSKVNFELENAMSSALNLCPDDNHTIPNTRFGTKKSIEHALNRINDVEISLFSNHTPK